ncbi:unnamed protein product [Lactuca saligna]|uniref:Uncharacterized protein n=1 Tax=Lactuca saligna TaxID=75948 RepID=A0AA35ZAJ3_LACSI|nr:unnamed protein product [Lactuca saligna]
MWIKHVICAYRNVLSVFKGTTWIHMHDHNSLNWLKLRYYPLWTQVSSIKANVVEDADALILQCESKTNCKHFFHVQIIRKTRMYFPMNSFQRTGRAKKTHDPAQDLSVLLCDKVSQLLCDSLVDGQSQSQSHGQKVKFDKLSMVGGKPQQHQETQIETDFNGTQLQFYISRSLSHSAEVLVLASGKDNMLSSRNEAQRLSKTL